MSTRSRGKTQDIEKSIAVKSQVISTRKLPSQEELDNLEIRFTNCTITYKLKHIETQASRSRRRKVAKVLGFSFQPLRVVFEGNQEELLFSKCIFNPSDRSILKEHIKNLETPRIRFINCKFLRRDSLLSEKITRMWHVHQGNLLKFTGHTISGGADVHNNVMRLKDLPTCIEFVIENFNTVNKSNIK